MSLHLYATEYLAPLPEATFQNLLTLLPPLLRQKVVKFRRWEDQHASLLGKLLLQTALKNVAGDASLEYLPSLEDLHYTPEHKPFFPTGPAFNIAHSGNRVVCLFGGNLPLGVDIESLTPLPFEDFQQQFTTGEWQKIHGDPNPLNAFYRLWTAKESILKADGRGLGIPLRSLDLSETMTPILDGVRWSIHELPLFDNYACHYCLQLPTPPSAEQLHIAAHPDAPPIPPAIEFREVRF